MSFNKNIFKKSSRKIHVNFSCNVKNDCPYIFFSTLVKYTNNTSVRIGDSEPWEAWMFLFYRNWHLPPGRNEASIWRQPLREGFPTSNGRYRQRYRLQTCIQQCSPMQRHLDKYPLPIDEKIGYILLLTSISISLDFIALLVLHWHEAVEPLHF